MKPRQLLIPAFTLSTILLCTISFSVNGFTQSERNNQDNNNQSPLQNMDVEIEISPTYPENIQKWNDEIVLAAHQFNLDPNLIAAVMLQESGGHSNVISSSGAIGLMQIMPRDGIAASFQCVNGPCFNNRPSIDELMNPKFNIQYGAKMLSGFLASTGSNRAALFAYGPMDIGYRYADQVVSIYKSNQ